MTARLGGALGKAAKLLVAAAAPAWVVSHSAQAAPVGDGGQAAQAQVWFERALTLDIGVDGAPNSAAAFAEMRRAADAGHPDAAFNVAVMLDSGRGAQRDVSQAAVWYARAAARGVRRAAFNLGQLYERGQGVPVNVDLSRAWYAAANLPAARERLAEAKDPLHRPARLLAPEPLFPRNGTSLEPGATAVDLVWTSALEPEAVRYFVELRSLGPAGSLEQWSGFVDVSSVRLQLPSSADLLAWRVSAVARNGADYVISNWSIVCPSTSTVELAGACKTDPVSVQTGG